MLANREDWVRDDREAHDLQVRRQVFTEPALFEREMVEIFERCWIFLCLESQIPRAFDFMTCSIGRQPVVVTRGKDGEINALLNSCRHKGAKVARSATGNRRYLVCPYHGWAYDCSGRSVSIKDDGPACYGSRFSGESHDLVPVPRVESYKGLVFGCLDPAAPSLIDYLGEARPFVDLVMDQGAEGMEFVPGRTDFAYRANWKLQMENGSDFYHLTSTHPTFVDIVSRRQAGESQNRQVRSPDFNKRLKKRAGMFTFEHGHSLIWAENPAPDDRPLHGQWDDLVRRVGPVKAEWMLNLRNLTIFPSLQLADSTSLILRAIQPLAVDRTEVRLHCLAPVGEPVDLREKRIRQHEDFFNVSGLATPDDATCYEDCQEGFAATRDLDWQQGYARGQGLTREGSNAVAELFGARPETSVEGDFLVQNETVFHAFYREWARRIEGV